MSRQFAKLAIAECYQQTQPRQRPNSVSSAKKALVSSIASTVYDSLTTKWGKVRSQVFSGPFKTVSMGPVGVTCAIAALAPAVQAQKCWVRARIMSWRAPPCPLHPTAGGTRHSGRGSKRERI